MLMPFDQLESHLSRPDQSLMYHMILQQMETNRLLNIIVNGQPTKEAVAVNIDDLKRPELMKLMGKREDAPQGWNKWGNEQIIRYLKGEDQ